MSTPSSNRGGFALLMVVLLLALLTGAVLHSQVSTRLQLRANTDRQDRLTLRSAVLDATWNALKNGMKAGTSATEYQTFEGQLPSGVQTKTTLQGLQREALPPPLQHPEIPVFGQLFSITTKATSARKSSLARGLACRLPTGEVRVLAWMEYP